jgi:hypothetical protein
MYNLLEPVELNRSYDQRIGKLQSSGAAAFSSIIGTTKKSRSRSASNYLPPFATDASSRMLRSLEPQRIGHPHYSAGQGKAGAPGMHPCRMGPVAPAAAAPQSPRSQRKIALTKQDKPLHILLQLEKVSAHWLGLCSEVWWQPDLPLQQRPIHWQRPRFQLA